MDEQLQTLLSQDGSVEMEKKGALSMAMGDPQELMGLFHGTSQSKLDDLGLPLILGNLPIFPRIATCPLQNPESHRACLEEMTFLSN